MTNEPVSPKRLSKVLRLCTMLVDRAFEVPVVERTVPADQVIAQAEASSLLQDPRRKGLARPDRGGDYPVMNNSYLSIAHMTTWSMRVRCKQRRFADGVKSRIHSQALFHNIAK